MMGWPRAVTFSFNAGIYTPGAQVQIYAGSHSNPVGKKMLVDHDGIYSVTFNSRCFARGYNKIFINAPNVRVGYGMVSPTFNINIVSLTY
jgi:selenophosphate synthetase-related protein